MIVETCLVVLVLVYITLRPCTSRRESEPKDYPLHIFGIKSHPEKFSDDMDGTCTYKFPYKGGRFVYGRCRVSSSDRGYNGVVSSTDDDENVYISKLPPDLTIKDWAKTMIFSGYPN